MNPCKCREPSDNKLRLMFKLNQIIAQYGDPENVPRNHEFWILWDEYWAIIKSSKG